MSKERPIKVRVIYKSGAALDFDCEDFKTSKNRLGEIMEVQWVNAWPKPITFGLADVAAIWRLA